MSPRPSSRAFTIIEVLVVIGTISLLMSLLVPQLGDAKAAAQLVVCGSHLHSNGAAITLYGHDNKGAFPDLFYDFPPGKNQANTVVILFKPKKAATTGWSYFQPGAMVCPCDDHPNQVHVIDDHTDVVTDMNCSYDVNVDFLLRNHTYDQVRHPDKLALMFDGNVGDGVKQGAYLGTQSWSDTAVNRRHFQRAAGANGGKKNSANTSTGKLASVLWADGHVTSESALPLSAFLMTGDKEWVHGGGSGGNGGGGNSGGGTGGGGNSGGGNSGGGTGGGGNSGGGTGGGGNSGGGTGGGGGNDGGTGGGGGNDGGTGGGGGNGGGGGKNK